MEQHLIISNYTFEEEYKISNRHKLPRVRVGRELINIIFPSFDKKELPIAFRVGNKKYFSLDGDLYVKKLQKDFYREDIEESDKDCTVNYFVKNKLNNILQPYYIDHKNYNEDSLTISKEQCKESRREEVERFISKFIFIDGVVYEKTGEPRYGIYTFGLGNNHAGIGVNVSVDNSYNPNIPKNRYFNALEEKTAIKKAKKIAKKRGDTKSIDYINKCNRIKVFMPEMVKCNPQVEHGEGDKFINKCENIIESCHGDNLLGGLLIMGSLFK